MDITDWIYKTCGNPDGRKLLGHYWGQTAPAPVTAARRPAPDSGPTPLTCRPAPG
ncbi:hypothetical protein [Streptomyces sp. NPDC054849]